MNRSKFAGIFTKLKIEQSCIKIRSQDGIGETKASKIFLFLLFLAFLLTMGRSQGQSYSFRHYGIDDGLPQSQVLKIFEDEKKYLWIGTESGISRFNGTDFLNYNELNGLSGNVVSGISQSRVSIIVKTESGISYIDNGKITNKIFRPGSLLGDFYKDRNANVWMINNGTLSRINQTDITHEQITPSAHENILTGAVDGTGTFYVVIYGDGVYEFSKEKWVKILTFNRAYKKIKIQKLLVDERQGAIYLSTYQKLYRAKNGVLTEYETGLFTNSHVDLFALAQDKGGALWVGSDHGAYYINGARVIHFTEQNGFTSNMVNDILIDRDDNVWLGTNGDGFYKFQGFNFESFNKKDDTRLQLVMGLGVDDRNHVWMGTNGYGLLKYQNGKLQNLLLPSSNPFSKYINSVYSKPGNPLLLATAAGLWTLDHDKFSLVNTKNIAPRSINAAIYDTQNTIWAAIDKGCFYIAKDGKVGQVSVGTGRVFTVAEVGQDSIVLGSDHGVVLLKNRTINKDFQCTAVEGYTVDCILRSHGVIICGTSGEGLFVLDHNGNLLSRFSTLNGLLSNDIYSLIADAKGDIWVGTGKGIDKLRILNDQTNYEIVNDIVPNPVAEFNQGAIFNHNNQIWAGTTNGVYVYANSLGTNINIPAPALNIESVKLSDQNGALADRVYSTVPPKIKLSYGNTHITITFRGIFYSQPDGVKYQYRLKGLDPKFSSPSKINQVEYSSVPPGIYTFQVQAITPGGQLSGMKEMWIEITPVFYQRTTFYILIVCLLVGLVLLIQWSFHNMKNRRRLGLEELKRNEQVKIRKQTAEDFHDDIGNKLTRIVVLTDILEHKINKPKQDLKDIIDQIKENARALFSGAKDIIWALDPKSDNLNELLNHIKNFAIDLFSNTDIDLLFDGLEEPLNRQLPLEYSRNLMMIFKELLNNILKHAAASEITLSVTQENQEIHIVLKDNGRGFNVLAQAQGRGLSNIKLRTERINGRVQVKSIRGKGTQTMITLLP